MNPINFAVELSSNRTAYERLREQIRQAAPGQYAAIAQGRLLSITATFDEGVAAVERLQPAPAHFLVFPVDEEPVFEVIDDLTQGLEVTTYGSRISGQLPRGRTSRTAL